MDLFDSPAPSLGSFFIQPKEACQALSEVLASDPLSVHYKAPAGHTARDLVRYLIACQTAAYGEQTTIPYAALYRGVKPLLKHYHPDTIKRATKLAAVWSPQPFTWKFVRERTLPEVIEKCSGFLKTM